MKPRTNILLRSQAYQLYFIEEPVDQLAFLLVMAHHSKKKNNSKNIQKQYPIHTAKKMCITGYSINGIIKLT